MDTTHKLLLGLLGGSSAAFSPLSISGLALWLDASDAATLFQDSGGTTPATANNDPVGRWADKSGNGRHAVQATGAKRPKLKLAVKNARNGVLFEGSPQTLVSTVGGTLSQPTTYWLVHQRTAAAAFGKWIIDGTGANRQQILATTTIMRITAGVNLDVSYDNTAWTVLTATFNGASSSIRANAVSIASGNAGASGIAEIHIGERDPLETDPSYFYIGYVLECIVATGTQSAATISAVESYLNAKWAVF